MDLVVRVCRFPSIGETIAGLDLRMIPGGKGANQAAAASRLGAKVAMIGRVGKDGFGQRLVSGLQGFGVGTELIGYDDDAMTGIALIEVDSNGQNEIVVVPGANASLGPAHVDAAESAFASAQILLAQLEVPLPTVAYALDVARHHGLTTILNAAPASPASRQLISKVDYLIVNETECRSLSGVEVIDAYSARKAAEHLLEMGAHAVVVTLGAKGAVLVDGNGALGLGAPQVSVVDTTAAGDAFIGGLVVPLLDGASQREALSCAIVAGSLAVTKVGAQSALPGVSELKEVLASSRLETLDVG